ncbi:MAG TPA: 3'(2'),5'-bisphosphate nucleotidase CysQ [Acidimicrobiales bacterium]|nr:3'(2'),5'-bisphosphate nucleotidase CysQ [Acidimicrobiales bacterium]
MGSGREVDEDDHAAARQIAAAAADTLLAVRAEMGFADAKALKDAGDARAEARIQATLAELRPGEAVLSEESADDLARLQAPRVWVVDPLDGTREFSEEGRDDFAVHVALVVDEAPVCGAVALPARGVTYSTGAHKPSAPDGHSGRPRLAVSRTRPPAIVDELATRLEAEVVPMGSAGVKAISVVTGEVDLYVHAGGQYEWDSAAPVAVALASGLHASRIDGSPLRYNQANPWLPDLVVCRVELAEDVLALLSELPV